MRLFFSEVPLIKVLLPYLGGMVMAEWWSPDPKLTTGVILFMLGLSILLNRFAKNLLIIHIVTLILMIVLFGLGLGMSQLQNPKHSQDHVKQLIGHDPLVFFTIKNHKPGASFDRYTIQILGTKDHPSQLNGLGILYIKASSTLLSLNQIYAVEATWQSINPPENPAQFDYARFCARRNIWIQAFSFENELHTVAPHPQRLANWIHQVQQRGSNTLTHYVRDTSAARLSKAITLGIRSDMPTDQMTLFRETGTAHILAVSGLHVGIVFSLLLPLTNKIRFRPGIGNPIKVCLPLAAAWLYVVICGLPPSGVRAATMCTFLTGGRAFGWRAVTLNTLTGSALLLLVLNPNWLWHIGFQFSYLALLGIIIFLPRLQDLIKTSSKLGKYTRDGIMLSVSAQIGILVLSIFYFHYTTPFFWIHSITSILFAYCELVLSLIILLVGDIIPILSILAGKINSVLYLAFETSAQQTLSIPGSVIHNISMPFHQVILWYTALAFISCQFLFRLRRGFVFGLLLLILSISIGFINKVNRHHTRTIQLFKAGQSTAAVLVYGKDAYAVSDTRGGIRERFLYEANNYTTTKGLNLNKIINLSEDDCHGAICLRNHSIFFAGRAIQLDARGSFPNKKFPNPYLLSRFIVNRKIHTGND